MELNAEEAIGSNRPLNGIGTGKTAMGRRSAAQRKTDRFTFGTRSS